jgi:hypothetical protein
MKMRIRLMLLAAPALLLVTSATTVRSQVSDPGDHQFLQSQGLWRDLDGSYWCGGLCGPNQRCCDIVIAPPAY